ncbi:hypothetical protein HY642_06885 [Candidatus Woesearchaeota archaeon]|nr:hypothetical protein [Candidatus Woesearchaeota archaeon]
MDIKAIILRKMFDRRIIGEKHTAFEHVMSGIPRHLAGDAKEAAIQLIRQGFIIVKPTSYGLQISLNPERMAEIRNIIEMKS